MFPSEILRQEIEEKYNINLSQYAWQEELKQKIFSTELDPTLETHAKTLKEIYEYGYNIGHCGLTSRYISRQIKEANLYYGKAKLLIGTKSTPNGEHAWTILNNHLIDSTLMIAIPIEKIKELGYTPEKEIAKICSTILSEYDTYEHEFIKDKIKVKTKLK